jgi:release factor glutamine methyltransferase
MDFGLLRHFVPRKDWQRIVTVYEVASYMQSAGICSPVVNAEIMLSHLLGCKKVELYTKTLMLGPADYMLLEQMISKRIKGEPLQYITGKACFYGNDIIVRKGVFIPRPETEILVDTVVSMVTVKQSAANTEHRVPNTATLILDLCTGSGNVAISLTKLLTHCKIISSDISSAALETASENARHNKVDDRISFLKADLLSLPHVYKNAFDIIVCNPPYIRHSELAGLSSEVKHEPLEALHGGADGMDFYRRIVKDSPIFLKNKGFIALELPDNSRIDMEMIIKNSGSFSDIRFFNDLNNIERVVVARLKC